MTALARFDPSGALSCINGIVEDITGQKQAEQQVQIVNKQMQDILTCIPDPVVIVDSKHAVLAWNAAMEKLTGVQGTGVIGRIDFCHHFPFYNPACPALFTLLDADDDEIKKYYPGCIPGRNHDYCTGEGSGSPESFVILFHPQGGPPLRSAGNTDRCSADYPVCHAR